MTQVMASNKTTATLPNLFAGFSGDKLHTYFFIIASINATSSDGQHATYCSKSILFDTFKIIHFVI